VRRRSDASEARRSDVRYMLLIYSDEKAADDLSEEERGASWQRWTDYSKWLQDKGWMLAGDPLQETAHATCVRNERGERIVTDGPYAETKEQLGGYYMIDVANLDDAIEAAARCPGADIGTMEVRPLLSMDLPPGLSM
jgi:hypothetical protein